MPAELDLNSLSHLPGSLQAAVRQRLAQMQRDEVIARIWAHDHTVWKDDPTEITEPSRLGWLEVASKMQSQTASLLEFAAGVRAAGFRDAVVLGMGGSSLTAEVLAASAPRGEGLRLQVLDSTVPRDILNAEASIDLVRTLFIVASKSGSTLETLSQFAYFWLKLPRGENFIAITDPGTFLERLTASHSFRRCFLNPESIGGRYSALSLFGLVPAALLGHDIESLLADTVAMQDACRLPAEANPGAILGALMAEAAIVGRDKLTLFLDHSCEALGPWLEQLIAESTGKEGKGILPVVDETPTVPGVYGDDRLFLVHGQAAFDERAHGNQASVRLPVRGLGAEFFVWQFATAVAGHILAVNPFYQPNVQQAKDATARFLTGGAVVTPADGGALATLLTSLAPGDYIALQAYLPRSDLRLAERLQRLRLTLRDRYRVATTLGFGPRFLHSTGQMHKGGPNSCLCIQLVDDTAADIEVPGQVYSFGRLLRAQADGDFDALLSLRRRVVRVRLAELEEVVA